jgi:polar amino acid transport system substrate-binding protein
MKFLSEIKISKTFEKCLDELENVIEDKSLIEKIKKEYIDAKKKSIIDVLTGFYNRRKFDEDLEDLFSQVDCSSNKHLSLIMIDIDDFKQINDNYGHDRGDMVLKWVTRVIKSVLRDRPNFREDHRIYRYGGEEFIVLLPNTDFKTAYVVAERIRRTLEYKSSGRITVSEGSANTFDSKCENAYALVKYADESLYKAKNMGKNRVVVNDRHYFEFLELNFQVDCDVRKK